VPASETSSSDSIPKARRRAAGSSSSSSSGFEHPGNTRRVRGRSGTNRAANCAKNASDSSSGNDSPLAMSVRVVEPRKDFAVGEEEKARTFSHLQRLLEGGRTEFRVPGFGFRVSNFEFEFRSLFRISSFGFRILRSAMTTSTSVPCSVEFHERIDGKQAAVGPHERVALRGDPRGDGLVVALASTDQRGAQVRCFAFLALDEASTRASSRLSWPTESGVTDGRCGMMLHADLA